MNEQSSPSPRPAPVQEPAGSSRRWFLGGALALVGGAGAGVGAQWLGLAGTNPPPPAPDDLLAAADRERTLIADLDATTGGTGQVRAAIVAARADHAAHLAALSAVLAAYRKPTPAPSTPSRGVPRTRAQLQQAEHRAGQEAASTAQSLAGTSAALLASIAACEASHAELLR